MANPPKRRIEGGGRVTPKGTRPESAPGQIPVAPRVMPPSPMWIPILMFSLLAAGLVIIFLNYTEILPGAANNWYLLAGLGCFLGGIITATQYR